MTTPARPRILIVGDVLLDRYLIGKAERISPEAPVPVVSEPREKLRPGGAAAVAWIAAGLGADVAVASVWSGDEDDPLSEMLADANVRLSGPVTGRRIEKTRYCAESHGHGLQQILRVDSGETGGVSDWAEKEIIATVESAFAEFVPDVVLIADYGKGVCTDAVAQKTIKLAADRGIPVLVDPARGAPLHNRYRGATLVKLNRPEALAVFGAGDGREEWHEHIAWWHSFPFLMVTCDREGAFMQWAPKYEQSGKHRVRWGGCDGYARVDSLAGSVVDVTGAGDAILAALGVLVAREAGLDRIEPERLLRVAMRAAAAEVSQFGVSQIPAEVLEDEPAFEDTPPTEDDGAGARFLPWLSKAITFNRRHYPAQKFALVNGCFDLLHDGHREVLKAAKQRADFVIVAINSDESVKRLKGPTRPRQSERVRRAALAKEPGVWAVLVFDEDTPLRVIEAIRPDVLVRGDEGDDPVGADLVRSWGGEVVIMPKLPGYSTSATIERMKQ